MVFKERLKEKRTEANLTQVELAEKAGVTARTIQNYELGSRKPSNMVTIQKIADGYTAEQIASAMSTDINLVALKVAHLATLGYNLHALEHKSNFLK